MAIIECDPTTCKKNLDKDKLFINWDSCRVFGNVNVFRCYKCGGFNRGSDNCERESRCLKCAEINHSSENCNNVNVKCYNCIEAQNNLNLDLNVDHSI